jgi:energy-coupling factor transporter ATP-binding protein EcfA2
MSFERFVCWKRDAIRLIETDAVDTPKAMFLATHQPMVAWMQEYGRDGTRHLVNEEAVLEAFEQERTTPLIMPIIGPSGSGKSHIVRWLRYSLSNRPDRLTIWVRRDRTSLADVVADLLDAIPRSDAALAQAVEGLREQLSEAVGVSMSELELRRRLVQDLAHHIRRLRPADVPYADPRAKDRWEFLIKENVGLPMMLDDPTFQQALIADGSVISRVAARIQRGRSGDLTGGEPLFDVEDLTP